MIALGLWWVTVAIAADWTPTPSIVAKAPDGGSFLGLLAADFDGDGSSELAWVDLYGVFFVTPYHTASAAAPLGPQPLHDLAAGDVNGDGYDDLVAEVFEDGVRWIALAAGSASGLSSLELIASTSPGPLVTIGDPNGDGLADFAIGEQIFVGSAAPPFLREGAVMPAWEGPGRMWGIPDVTGDGIDDLLVPEWTAEQAWGYTDYIGGMAVYAGAPDLDGARVWSIPPPEDGLAVGHVALARDLDGDGVVDLMLTAASFDGSVLGGDVVWVDLDGPEPKVVRRRDVSGANWTKGLQLLDLGDPDGHGHPSVAWVADGAIEEWELGADAIEVARRWVNVSGPQNVHAVARDLDGDGQVDLAASWVTDFFTLDEEAETSGVAVWLSGAPPPDTGVPGAEPTPIDPDEDERVSVDGCACAGLGGQPHVVPWLAPILALIPIRRRRAPGARSS